MAPQGIIDAGEIGDEASTGGLLLVDLELFVDQGEVIGKNTEALRTAEHEVGTGLERVVHGGDNALLQFRTEIDEKVAATDEIEAREWRIPGDVLFGKNADLANGLRHLVAFVHACEKAFEASGGDIGEGGLRIDT